MSDPFDLEVLRTLDKKPLTEAKTIALDILDKSKTKATRLNRLKYDINRANTAIEVTRIMWTTYMAVSYTHLTLPTKA